MLTSYELREAVERRIGPVRSDIDYIKAEQEAREKLNRINKAAGRVYGKDGYGDVYLVTLTVEMIRQNRLQNFINNCGDTLAVSRG